MIRSFDVLKLGAVDAGNLFARKHPNDHDASVCDRIVCPERAERIPDWRQHRPKADREKQQKKNLAVYLSPTTRYTNYRHSAEKATDQNRGDSPFFGECPSRRPTRPCDFLAGLQNTVYIVCCFCVRAAGRIRGRTDDKIGLFLKVILTRHRFTLFMHVSHTAHPFNVCYKTFYDIVFLIIILPRATQDTSSVAGFGHSI